MKPRCASLGTTHGKTFFASMQLLSFVPALFLERPQLTVVGAGRSRSTLSSDLFAHADGIMEPTLVSRTWLADKSL